MYSFMAGSAKLMRCIKTIHPIALGITLLALLGLPSAAMAQEFTVHSSATVGNVTAIEVSGIEDYFSAEANGTPHSGPRMPHSPVLDRPHPGC